MVTIFDSSNNVVKTSANGFFRMINGQPCFYDYKAKSDIKPSQKMCDDYCFTIGQPIAMDNGGFAYVLCPMAGFTITIDKGTKATKIGTKAKASQPSPFIASLLALMANADAAKAIISRLGLDADADANAKAKAKAKADAAKAKADAAMAKAAKAKADADAAKAKADADYFAAINAAMVNADETTILAAMADAAKAKADADAKAKADADAAKAKADADAEPSQAQPDAEPSQAQPDAEPSQAQPDAK